MDSGKGKGKEDDAEHDRDTARPRSRSEAVQPRREVRLSPSAAESGSQPRASGDGDVDAEDFGMPRRAATTDFRSPRRAATSAFPDLEEVGSRSLRRRSTAASRRTAQPSTAANRTRGMTLGQAGPEETPQLWAAHENYVHPGYAELNPSYEQPASSKPVWSLAKPLPRVIRPGMVPTRSEILEAQQGAQQGAQLPRRNTVKVGLDVNPTDLEEGRIEPTPNPAKLSAQLKDSRAQRETNFLSNVQRRGTTTSRLSSRPTRASSTASQTGRRQRASSRASQMTPADETEEAQDDEGRPSDQLEVPGEELGNKLSQQHSFGPDERLDTIPENQVHDPPPRKSHESQDSAQTAVDDEGDLYADMNELKLTAENAPLYDEIHNNHTTWSIVRTHNREFLAELLAVFIQLSIGFCSDTSATLTSTSNANTTAWAWGFATMIGIYLSGGISGAHLNPAITIVLWFYRGFPKRKMVPYFAAQFLGAFIAALASYGLYLASIQEYNATNNSTTILNGFVTSQRHDYIGPATAFFNEFLGTACLAATVLALGDDQNAPPGAGMNSLIIGLVITALNFGFAYQTGAAMNPSRDFGPRLAMLALGYPSELFTNPYWFYGPFAGTICGAMVGGGLYDICIFTGGESPINYPWTRTKRSFKKGKRKWARRLHLKKKNKEWEEHL